MVPEERGARPHPSGFRTFLNWFRRVERETERNRPARRPSPAPVAESDSDSDGSETSTATASSFAFLPPAGYRPYGEALAPRKYIACGPYTDTYRRRVAERDRRRRLDCGVTLRNKYRLHTDNALETLAENNYAEPAALERPRVVSEPPPYDTLSLPALCRQRGTPAHRRAASETKFVRPRPLSYVHVKGKRRAPPPPTEVAEPAPLTATLTRRVKRMAPPPPTANTEASAAPAARADAASTRPEVKLSSTEMRVSELLAPQTMVTTYEAMPTDRVLPSAPPFSSLDPETRYSLAPSPTTNRKQLLLHSKSEESWRPRESGELSPKPWYKRQFSENKTKSKEERPRRTDLPHLGFFRYSKIFDSKKATSPKSEQKRFSGVLPNISELDREAAEILQMHKRAWKEENNNSPGLNNPRSARLLITKFNQMNNLKAGEDLIIDKTEETNLKSADDTWVCMKCEKRNNAKKIICSQCFAKKPREDDLFAKNLKGDLLQSFESEVLDALKHLGDMTVKNGTSVETKTDKKPAKEGETGYKEEEKRKLRDMLREMKNSLPKQHRIPVKENTDNTIPKLPSSSTVAVHNESNDQQSSSSTHYKLQNLLNRSNSTCSTKSASADTSLETKNTSAVANAHIPTPIHEHGSPVKSSAKNIPKPSAPKLEHTENGLYANVLVTPRDTGKIPAQSHETGATNESNPKVMLKYLQTAISAGDDAAAADIAKKLAQMKVHCTVLSSTATLLPHNDDGDVTVSVYIEDAESAAGPVRLRVRRDVTLPQLRAAVQRQLDIPTALQRWIVGKHLCVDDKPLSAYNGGDFSQPLFLYLVSPAKAESEPRSPVPAKKSANSKESPPGSSKSSASTSTALNSSSERADDSTKSTQSVESKPVATVMSSSSKSYANSIQKSIDTRLISPTAVKEAASAITATREPISSESASLISPVVSTKAIIYTAPTALVSTLQDNKVPSVEKIDHYQELVELESRDLIPNQESFSCMVCLDDCDPTDGVVLRDCLHTFCRACLGDTVRHCDQAQVTCPYRDKHYSCDSTLQEREVRALVPKEDYERHLAKSVQLAESNMQGTFHCKTADCRGWCVYENTVNTFRCPICRRTNCLTCQVIHEGDNCAQYQARIRREAAGSGASQAAAECTRRMLQDMCAKGDALECPSCQVVLMKKWGCDWVRCSMCKTEICWVTRGARWGPGGKGDTSAGCRCGVDGVKCHPSCNYCH